MPSRTARLSVAAAFFVQGLIFISLTTRLPNVQSRWHLDSVQLSLMMLMMVVLAGVGSLVAERASSRVPSGVVLRAGLLLIGLALPVLALASTLGTFLAGLAAYGVALGAVDATSNAQAVAVEHAYGRPILPSFHGAWTLGGVIGAALALVDPTVSTAGWLALVALASALAARFMARAPVVNPDAVAVPRKPLLLVGAGLVLFYMVDTAAQTWGPTYLGHTLGSPARLVALATFPYLIAAGLMRLAGDRMVSRFGAPRVLRIGALVAAAALALIVFAPTWPVAVAGFTLLGAGAAVIAPLSFSAAARIAGGSGPDRAARVDAVIARFNQFNYLGALLGSVATGLVGKDSLRYGFALPMVLILLMIPLAPAFTGQEE